MTKEQALQILTMATANIPATRDQHNQIAMALQVINQAIAAPIASVKKAE